MKTTNLKGEAGALFVTDTSAHAGDFESITALTATVIAAMTSSTITGTLAGMTLPAGTTIFGRISTFTLTSGTVLAYNANNF